MELAVKGKAKRRHLNAEECGELVSDALTRPQTVRHRQSSRDPDQRLHPRTPTKRQKLGSSADQQQRGISDFFSVTGVVSSSPRKSSQPGSSTHTHGLQGELAPKEEPEEEEEEEDEDEDDDVSLLATPVKAEPEEEVDYLEGITAEMFGDDEEFDHCAAGQEAREEKEQEEDEVEALPDAHYGLLGGGGGRSLLEPRGCLDDLPEEVLRQLLSLLPAQDLYRNASRVCHRWSSIVQDPKFVPLKKQYYRYMMKEKDTVQEVNSILKNGSILDPATSQHSVRHLVVVMAQHKLCERVRPEDVLQCVKKHRLFPQAESCLRLRLPDIQKHISLGIEGPNPYASMAVILILSEGVGDVQELVSLLAGRLSHTAITEFLSQMATMLLAMMRNDIQISSRLHYNIFYVLHLMENSSSSAGSGQSGRRQVQVTHEQQQILSHDIQTNHVVKIMAFAGTGKTTTLVKYAEQRPHLRFLYAAFNKSVANQAQRCFPSNVSCKTVHSMAFSDVGRRFQVRKKLTFNLKPFSIAWVMPEGRGGFIHAKVVTTTLNTFMASADQRITASHVPPTYKNNRGIMKTLDYDQKLEYMRNAQDIWDKMKDPNETREEGYYMTHDGYLKLWQLKNPKPCLSEDYDVIFIDEAQDCTPAILDVLLSQRCGKILVGDPHQQIYTFRGAVNALRTVQHTHLYYLTQSFRFGAEIAFVGATILKVCKGVQKILVGGNQKGSVCGESVDTVAMARSGVSGARGQTAILSRCNVSVFSEAVRLTDANPHCRIHFVGGVVNAGLNKIMDIWLLMQAPTKPTRRIQDSFIRSFLKSSLRGYAGLKEYATQSEDRELEAKLSVVEKYNSRIPELVSRLTGCYENDYHNADFILGTVHKAKGLEFDTVMVTDDFVKIPCARHNLHRLSGFCWGNIPEDEWNLLYVAVTRAKTSLIFTKNISHILTLAGEYFLRSELTGPLLKDGLPPRCCVRDCPNSVTPGSAFTMCKRPMKYMDSVCPGGPLCEMCVWKRIGPTAFLMTDDVLSLAEAQERLELPINYQMLLVLF
ncbi:F-box DNA helicase 1 [Centroberyx affinis]|uniref:F-box DNA helicase 1 n=1 Tax=Centroberyx affinis TaxID=166261 RepID=UPI003A5C6D14